MLRWRVGKVLDSSSDEGLVYFESIQFRAFCVPPYHLSALLDAFAS